MTWRIKLALGIFFVVLIGVVWYALSQTVFKPKPVHYHAGFQVYVNDKLQSFSGNQYMHEKPCVLSNGQSTADTDEDDQGEKAHLHDHIGDVVHVHRNGAMWSDLFFNIKYPLDGKISAAYINGQKVDDILKQPIKPYDSVVIFVGKHTDDQKYLKNIVTKVHIQSVEKKSESCGTTGS